MICKHEGYTRKGPGSGPHWAREECGACGKFLKWLPWPRTPEGEQQFIDRFTAIAKSKGYLPGWIAHKFHDTFGHWPEHNLSD